MLTFWQGIHSIAFRKKSAKKSVSIQAILYMSSFINDRYSVL